MAVYMAHRILVGAMDYKAVATKFPQYKSAIDTILIAEGREDLIVDIEV